MNIYTHVLHLEQVLFIQTTYRYKGATSRWKLLLCDATCLHICVPTFWPFTATYICKRKIGGHEKLIQNSKSDHEKGQLSIQGNVKTEYHHL